MIPLSAAANFLKNSQRFCVREISLARQGTTLKELCGLCRQDRLITECTSFLQTKLATVATHGSLAIVLPLLLTATWSANMILGEKA